MIDKKLQSYYENRFSMMATTGWQDLMEDAQQLFDSLNQVLPIQNETDLQLKRGQLDILNWLLNLKPASEAAFEQLNDSTGVAQNEF
jgi:hypothetical protein